MIAFLQGTISAKEKDTLTVMTSGGVGYEVHCTPLRLAKYAVGQEIPLFAYLKVGETAFDLYGFETADERSFFKLLMTVSGVGPKSAMNILSLGSMDEIQAAIARGDVKYLTAVQGMGKKTAERVVVELRSKVKLQKSPVEGVARDSSVLGEVVEALVAMGYSAEESRQVARELDGTKKSEELLRQALQRLAR